MALSRIVRAVLFRHRLVVGFVVAATLLLFLRQYITSPAPALQISSSSSPLLLQKEKKLLVIIPGVGCANEKRLRIALDNIRQLEQQFSHAPGYAFECSVGAFVERRAFFTNGSHTLLGESLRKIEKRCYVSYQPGAHFSDFLKTLHPMLVRRGGYGYVLVLLDDVRLGSFELPAALALAAANGVGVSSPVVRNALHFPVGLQNEGERKTLARASARSPASPASVQAALAVMDAASSRSASASWSQWWGGRPSPGVYTDFVEVFATVFDADAWDCWWGMLDTTRLSKGWVYDEQLFHMCSKQRKKSDDADDSSPGGAKQQANAKNRHRLRRSGALLQPQPPFRMAVLPGMEAEHDTNGYYDSSGYCAVLERYEDTRALPPGAQYTKWHEASAARGDYASGRAVRPMEPCCQGALKGAFGG